MKINEIILESTFSNYELIRTNAMNNQYGAAGTEFDEHYNKEVVDNIKHEYQRYKKLGNNPVFLQSEKQQGDKYTTKPPKDATESAGFRGREAALERAGIQRKPQTKKKR